MNDLLEKLMHRAQLQNPLVLAKSKAEFCSLVREAEIIVRLQLDAGKIVNAPAWQTIADALYIVGATLESTHGSDDPDARVIAGGYRALIEAVNRPGYRATSVQLAAITVALDRTVAVLNAAQSLGPFQPAVDRVMQETAAAQTGNQ